MCKHNHIIQLVNKSTFLWNCLRFKWAKLTTVTSTWVWWSPVIMESSTKLSAPRCLGASWLKGSVASVSCFREWPGCFLLQHYQFWQGQHWVPLIVRASLNLSHTQAQSQVRILPVVSWYSSISYVIGLEPGFLSTTSASKHKEGKATCWSLLWKPFTFLLTCRM